MKLILTPAFIFILFMLPCPAQKNLSCPDINVTAPQGAAIPGQILTFSVSSGEASENLKLDYHWRVSAGTIIQGQKTPVINVDTAGFSDTNVVATVEIKGLAENCLNIISGTGFLAKLPPSALTFHNCDTYGKPSKEDEFARLDPSAIALLNDRNSVATIQIESKELNARLPKIFNYLTKQRGIAKNRLIFAVKNSELELTRICLWTKDRATIDCDGCRVIKGENFDPKKLNKKF